MCKRQGRKRLAVDLPIEMHNEIAHLARRRNIQLKVWLMRAITKEIIWEKHDA